MTTAIAAFTTVPKPPRSSNIDAIYPMMSNKRPLNDDHDATLSPNSKNIEDETRTSTSAAVAGIIMDQDLPIPTVDETNTMDVEVTQTNATRTASKSEGIFYVAVDGLMSQMLEIKVKQGDSIPTIRKAIKSEGRNTFASYDAFQIKLYQSKEQTETKVTKPMSATTNWNSEVTWGTVEQPLIVYTPEAINSGKCILVTMTRVCDFVHSYVSKLGYPYSRLL